MDSPRVAPGLTLSGHLLSEEIGAGGHARVFRSVRTDGTSVAIKVALRPEAVGALRAEAAALRRLEGSHCVRILEEHLDAETPFVVLEHCPGGDLRRLLDAQPRGHLTPEAALDLFNPIAKALAQAHRFGLVHGDVKPENVLLDARGEPRLADFGLARALGLTGIDGSLATGEGVRGTFDYLAPELRRGQPATPASDVYALGVLLYEMLTGRKPLGSYEKASEILEREDLVVWGWVDRIIARALAVDPRDRYRDANALLASSGGDPEPTSTGPRASHLFPIWLTAFAAGAGLSFGAASLGMGVYGALLFVGGMVWGVAFGAVTLGSLSRERRTPADLGRTRRPS